MTAHEISQSSFETSKGITFWLERIFGYGINLLLNANLHKTSKVLSSETFWFQFYLCNLKYNFDKVNQMFLSLLLNLLNKLASLWFVRQLSKSGAKSLPVFNFLKFYFIVFNFAVNKISYQKKTFLAAFESFDDCYISTFETSFKASLCYEV